MLHDVRTHVQKISFVLYRDKRAFRAIVFSDLERFRERTEGLDVSLNAHVSKHKQRRADRRFSKR